MRVIKIVWLYDRESISNHFVNHYKNLFIGFTTQNKNELKTLIQSEVTKEENQMLTIILIPEEIYQTLKAMNPHKSLGLDGYP